MTPIEPAAVWYGHRPMRGHASNLRLVGAALLVGAVVLAPSASGDPSQSLHARETSLESKSRAAVLSLYSIDSQLTRAHSRLTSIRGRAELLRRERELVALRLQIAKRGMRISQNRLASRLRAIYEHGEIDPIAIVLGADSLDTALTGLENLGQMANGDRNVVEQVRGARHNLTGLRHVLDDRQRTLDRLVAAAATTARSLEATRASRAAYVSQLASERRMTQAAISRVEEQAQAARLKTQRLQLASAAPLPTIFAEADPAVPADGRSVTVSATGYALPGTTATGLPVGWGVAAVDPSVIPLGTHFTVPGYGEAVAADVGSGVQGSTIDLWFPSIGQAQAWGRRIVTITLH
jgi:3D (Asp-Asp-Asp) domain-containing protein